MLFGRLREAAERRPWSPEYLRKEGAFEEALSQLWFDAHVHDDRVLAFTIDMLGDEHLVLGTNFSGWDQHHLSNDQQFLQRLTDNARRLLRV